jgi:hypothetical protein
MPARSKGDFNARQHRTREWHRNFDRFVASLLATFGGTTTKQGVFIVTPTPSSTMSQLVLTPVGTVSVFGFKTPVPYPFGAERTGYLVTDLDAATRTAVEDGADVLVSPFNDPIGRDVVIQWPGGANMQLYWHTVAPSYKALQTIPENRVYVSTDRVEAFLRSFLAFSHGKVVSDDPACARRRDRTAEGHLSQNPDRIELRQVDRACNGWSPPVSLRTRDDRL